MTGSRPNRPRHDRPLRRFHDRTSPNPTSDSPELEQRLRELDAQHEPLSLAEEIASEQRAGRVPFAPQHRTDEAPNVLETNVSEMQQLPLTELRELARQENIEDVDQLERQQLIFRILKERVRTNGMMFGEGTLEILPDGFGFLRNAAHHYVSCPDDIYVSPSQIRRFGLQTGDTVAGQIRPPKENERYFALLRVEVINRFEPNMRHQRVGFEQLTPLHPNLRVVLETDPSVPETRVIDLVAPLGFGQRGLIVSPPRAGKTVLMQKMARAVLKNYPEAFVIMLLIDERPEEVTDMEREVRGRNCEVVSSTFDEPASRHIQVSNMVLEKAKRMVEYGVDVIIFLDSITRLARAWNSEVPQSGKLLTGGLDANALQKPKAFFGSARRSKKVVR